MYDERFVTPMRQEVVQIGVEEMRTPAEVDAKLKDAKGTTLVVVNSICGCAARNARPAVAKALQHAVKPERSRLYSQDRISKRRRKLAAISRVIRLHRRRSGF